MKRLLVIFLVSLLAGGCGAGEEPSPAPPPSTEDARSINPIALTDWANFRGQPELTGRAGGELPAELHLRWSFASGAPTLSSPVIVGEHVFVGNDDGKVFAISLATGKEVWSVALGEPDDPPIIEAPPFVADGRIYVGDDYGVLWCLDAADGAVQWSFTTQNKIVAGASVVGSGANSLVLVASHDAILYGLDRDGKKRWEYEGDNYLNAMPAVGDGRAFVGGCDGLLHIVDLEDGTGIARWEVGSYVASSAAIAGGRAFVAHMDGRVLCLEIESGERLWEYGTGRQAFFSSPAVDEHRIVIGGRDKHVHCIDRATGEARWTFPTGGDVDGSPVLCGPRVVVGSEDGRLYVLDIETGDATWSYEIGTPLLTTPAVARGVVVTSAQDGVVHAFAAN